jgi:hypothetical protein
MQNYPQWGVDYRGHKAQYHPIAEQPAYGRMTMTAFNLFQRATCEIAEGNRAAAVKTLTKAIAKIDRDGVDAGLRADLVDLCDMVAA